MLSLQLFILCLYVCLQEEFQLRIAIGDTGEGSSNEVDTIVIQRNDISPSETFTAMENFLGVHGNAIMELSFRLTCKGNFYGTDCATFCEQTDHDTLGHFSCDENGNRVCLDGYTDPTTNCVTMSCDSECAGEFGIELHMLHTCRMMH